MNLKIDHYQPIFIDFLVVIIASVSILVFIFIAFLIRHRRGVKKAFSKYLLGNKFRYSKILNFVLISIVLSQFFYFSVYPRVFDCLISRDNREVENVRPDTGEVVYPAQYYKGEFSICYSEGNSYFRTIDTNMDEFETIVYNNFGYKYNLGKDSKNIFFAGEKMSWDVETFDATNVGLFLDKNGVYTAGKGDILEDVDPLTLDVFYGLGGLDYFKDKDSVYYNNKVVQEADPESFYLSGSFGFDKNNVYYEGEIFNDFDPETFEDLGNGTFYKDAYKVMYAPHSEFMDVLDPPSFERIVNFFAKDKYRYYYHKSIIPDVVDRDTFEVVYLDTYDYVDGSYKLKASSFAKDKNYIYDGAKPIKVSDVNEVEFLGETSFRDKITGDVYENGELVEED
jgi:hypothetical protein